MPIEFKNCVDRGGTVRTEVVSSTEYRAVCTIDDEVFYGETKTKLTKQEKRRNARKAQHKKRR